MCLLILQSVHMILNLGTQYTGKAFAGGRQVKTELFPITQRWPNTPPLEAPTVTLVNRDTEYQSEVSFQPQAVISVKHLHGH